LAIILHEDNTWTATEEQEDEVAVISCMLNKSLPGITNDSNDDDEVKVPSTSISTSTSTTTTTSSMGVLPLKQPRQKKTALPFRIKLQYNNKVRYTTLTQAKYSMLSASAIRKYPTCVKSNDTSLKLQFFVTKGNVKLEIADDAGVQKLEEDDVIQISSQSVVPSLSTFPTNLARWYYWDDDNKWKPYTKSDSDLIEQAFTSGTTDKLTMHGTYTITISARTQVRPTTGKQRAIIRGTWYWTADSNSMVPYDENIAAKLETAYQDLTARNDQTGSKQVDVDTTRYCTVKLSGTIQYNRSYGTARVVKRGSS